MTPVPPLSNEHLIDPTEPVDEARKPRSVKNFLRAGVTPLAIGLGVFGGIGLTLWLARKQVATTSLTAFLKGKGIPADVTIEKLQLNGVHIRDLRLGPPNAPSLTAKTVELKWHFDSRTRMLIVEQAAIDGVTGQIGLDKNGKLDFGALAPLMKPATGPKRFILSTTNITNALVTINTPAGPAKSQLKVWGSEATGWTGRADVTPPISMMAAGTNRDAFVPMRFGFAYRPATAREYEQTKAGSLVGFAAQPDGQSLLYEGITAARINGAVTGQLTLGRPTANQSTSLRLDLNPATLSVARIAGNGVNLSGLNLATNRGFWSQGSAWQTTSIGNVIVTGSLANLDLDQAWLKVGSTRFVIGAARAQSGRMQLDYQVNARSLVSPVSGGRLGLEGNVSTTLKDLTQISSGEFSGRGKVTATDFLLPAAIGKMIPATLPPEVTNALKGRFSSASTFDYRFAGAESQVALVGPLNVAGSGGLRASWTPDRTATPRVIIKSRPNNQPALSGLGTGRVTIDWPAFGTLSGEVDGASFGESGWGLVGRAVSLRSQTFAPGNDGLVTFDRLEVSASKTAPFGAIASGQIAMNGAQFGRARLGFDVRATPARFEGTLSGPVDGFGAALGLGGYGVRDGMVNVAGNGVRDRSGWQYEGRGTFRARTFATNSVSADQPDLTLTSSGSINTAKRINARYDLTGRATQASPQGGRSPSVFNGAAITSTGSLVGDLANLNVQGKLSAILNRGILNGVQVERTRSDATFSGVLTPSQARLSGNQATTLGRIVSTSGPQSSRIDVAGVRASGPFSVQTGKPDAVSPFWNGDLLTTQTTISSTLSLSADRVRSGGTSLKGLSLYAPTNFTNNGDNWRATSDLRAEIQTLNSGDTQLRGVIATGPLAAIGGSDNPIRFNTNKCLAFDARSGSFPGQASIGAVSGKLCPDRAGRLAILGRTPSQLFATAQLDPLTIQIGGTQGDQRVEIGEVSGTLSTQPNGQIGFGLLASQFGLNFKMPDGTIATVKANEARLDIVSTAGGISLEGQLGNVSSLGLPVLISGGATAKFLAGAKGLGGTFTFDDLIVKDIEKSPRFGELRLVGGGELSENTIMIASNAIEPVSNIKMASVTLSHDIETGTGALALAGSNLNLAPTTGQYGPGLDIVQLIPPLRGVVSDMVGIANVSADFAWARNLPLRSNANIETKGLNFNTILGPVTAFAGDVRLDDVPLVRTLGQQTITIGLFDPGLPIANGNVQFSLPGNNSLRLESASWPFADGQLSVRPATWAFRDGDQAFAIDVESVDLAKLLRLTDVPNLEIDGKVSGVFPIKVVNGSVEIVGGRLKAREGGGVIRYTGPNVSPPPPPPSFFGRFRQRLFGKPAPTGANLAIEALRALEYKILEITVDGRITGELQIGVILEGANQQVLSGQPFKFNIKTKIPIGQLLDNLDNLNNIGSNAEVITEIDRLLREETPKVDPASPPALAAPPPVAPPTPPNPPTLPTP